MISKSCGSDQAFSTIAQASQQAMVRSSEQSGLVITGDQAQGVDAANRLYAEMHASAKNTIIHAFCLGLVCNQLKTGLRHGAWMEFRAANLPAIPHRTATYCMNFAREAEGKWLGGSGVARLTDGRLPQEEEKRLLTAVHQFSGARTLSALMRELGIMRQKRATEYHPPHARGAKEIEDAKDRDADEVAQNLLRYMEEIMQGDTWTRLEDGRQETIEQTRLMLGTFIKKHSPKRKPAKVG